MMLSYDTASAFWLGTLAQKRFLPLIATLDAVSFGKLRTVGDARAQGYFLYFFSASSPGSLQPGPAC